MSGVDDVLSRGDWFGEEALMDAATPAAADVVAITDVELLILSGNDLRWVIGEQPGQPINMCLFECNCCYRAYTLRCRHTLQRNCAVLPRTDPYCGTFRSAVCLV